MFYNTLTITFGFLITFMKMIKWKGTLILNKFLDLLIPGGRELKFPLLDIL